MSAGKRASQLAEHFISSFNDDSGLPEYADLPCIPGTTYRCSWGLFDTPSHGKDELGTLNLLTPDRVLRAASSEIRTGESVSLNWGMENVRFPGFGRTALRHDVIDLGPRFIGRDDEVSFNTQCGSQWDGLCHAAHQGRKLFYNGLRDEDLRSGKDVRNGLHRVNDRGGICARGVLLDWRAYAERHGIPVDPVSRQAIPLSELEACAQEQGVVFHVGDILFIRSGFVKWHNEASDGERKAGTQKGSTFIGLEATEESFAWHWNHHFSAVVGDTVAYEQWPPAMLLNGPDAEKEPMMHEMLLACFGTLIGEMWDLEALAEKCKAQNRYSFFVTSAPLNVKGGIGSPPNALAIF